MSESTELEISRIEEDDTLLVSYAGEVKPGTEVIFSDQLNSVLSNVAETKRNVILDFKELEYINSTGLGVIANFYRTCKEEKVRVVICNLNTMVAKLFEITKLDQIFTIVPSLEDARTEVASD